MPSTPREELARRAAALQRHLAAQTLDVALIAQNTDLFYFAGSMQSGLLLVPARGQPVYAVRRVLARARRESGLADLVSLESFRELPGLLQKTLGGPARRVGAELDVLPVVVRDRWAAALPGVEWVDISPAIRTVRSVKSEYELTKMRATARLAQAMLQAGLENLKEGMTEMEFAGRVEAVARRAGHQGIVRVRGWNQEAFYGQILSGDPGAVPSFPDMPLAGEGPSAAVPYGPGRRRIVAGEPVIFDYTAVLDGYICDQTRTLAIGPLPEKFVRAHEAAVTILKDVASAIRPGVAPQDLYHRALDRAAKLGYAEAFMGVGSLRARYVGHGVGLELDEWPVLADGFADPLEPGQVVCVEPKMLFPGEGAVGIEDEFAVTPDGVERLTLPEQRLFTI